MNRGVMSANTANRQPTRCILGQRRGPRSGRRPGDRRRDVRDDRRAWRDVAVPQHERGAVAPVGQDRQRPRVEPQPGRSLDREAQEAGADRTEAMPVTEQQHVALARPEIVHEDVDAVRHLLRGLARRTSVAEQLPRRLFLPDLCRREALVVAVVVLAEVVADRGALAEPRDPRRLARPPHRAREHALERPAREELAEGGGLEPALAGERDIRAAGVLAGYRPLGLAVAYEPDRHPRSLGRLGMGDCSNRTYVLS